MHATALPALRAQRDPAALASLRCDLDAHRGEVAQAVDSLVHALLDLQDQRIVPLEDKLTALAGGLQAVGELTQQVKGLTQRLDKVEKDLDLERSRHDLAHMSRMAPKDRIVVFVGRWHFGDNLKYAWLEALEHSRRAGWACWYLPPDAHQESLVRGLGANCLPADPAHWTPEHFLVAQRTAVLVIADHFFPAGGYPHNPYAPALFAGARTVQLWHGISIKEIALRFPVALGGMNAFLAGALASCGHYAAFVGGSMAAEPEWRRWFAFDHYAAIGYPRSDVLLREPTPGDLLNVDTAALQAARAVRQRGGRVAIYAPTFRDREPGRWLHGAGLPAMADALAARGDLLLVNLHPLEAPAQPALQQAHPQVRFTRPHTDLYPLLRETDLLVTDYSSLMFDYLPLDRPMLFYRPDHDDYVRGSRPLHDAKVARLPGRSCASLPDLLAALRGDWRADDTAWRGERQALCSRIFDRVDDGAARRVCALIDAELERALAAH